MAKTRLTTPEKDFMEVLKEKGELTVCNCGTRIWKYWHRKTGPKGNTTYPLMEECGPCHSSVIKF